MGWALSRVGWWMPAAVALGLALRGYHFLNCPSVWQDEAALIVNVLRLSFAEMLGPLIHSEAAPPLFLIAERGIVLGLGDGEYALRLLPFAASCLSLLLFAGLASRLLGPASSALAVGLFAISDRLLWHSCEAKPYTIDVLVAVAAAYWFVRTEGWPLLQRCLPAAALAPLALWSSFPACFVAGGLLAGLAPAAVRSNWRGRTAYLALAASVGVSFLTLALGPAAAQRSVAMEGCWTTHFPDWSRPWTVPNWSVMQSLEVARYCLYPAGQVLFPLAMIGVVAFGRRPGGPALIAVLLLPLGLALVAAYLHRYPYGGTRVEVFAAPALILLGAAGLRHAIRKLTRRPAIAAILVAAVILPPLFLTSLRTAVPWARPDCRAASHFMLDHRKAADPILANHWEYEYYLRDLPDGWRMWNGSFQAEDLRTGAVWVIHTDANRVSRFPFPIPLGWSIAEQIEFERTAVFRLERIDAGAPGKGE